MNQNFISILATYLIYNNVCLARFVHTCILRHVVWGACGAVAVYQTCVMLRDASNSVIKNRTVQRRAVSALQKCVFRLLVHSFTLSKQQTVASRRYLDICYENSLVSDTEAQLRTPIRVTIVLPAHSFEEPLLCDAHLIDTNEERATLHFTQVRYAI